MSRPSLVESFSHALRGIGYAVRSQPNVRHHLAAAAIVSLLGVAVELAPLEWSVLILAITLVIGAEMMNTAVELTMDRISGHYHPLAKAAKDVAAASVLVCAGGAVLIGSFLFLPKLFRLVVRP